MLDHPQCNGPEPGWTLFRNQINFVGPRNLWLATAIGLSVLAMLCGGGSAARDAAMVRELATGEARSIDATLNAAAASARAIAAMLGAEPELPGNAEILLEEAAHQPFIAAALLTDDHGRVVVTQEREELPTVLALRFKEVGASRNWAGAALLRDDGLAADGYIAVSVCSPVGPGAASFNVQLIMRAASLTQDAGGAARVWLLGSGAVFAAESGGAAASADTAALWRRWVSARPALPHGRIDVPMRGGWHRLYYERLPEWPMTIVFDSGPAPLFGLRSQDILGFALLLAGMAMIWLIGRNTPVATGDDRLRADLALRRLGLRGGSATTERMIGGHTTHGGWGDGAEGLARGVLDAEGGCPDLVFDFAATAGFTRQTGGLQEAIGGWKSRFGGRPTVPTKLSKGHVVSQLAGLGLPQPHSGPARRWPRGRLRILLVDDVAPVRENISRRLRGLGFEVVEAHDISQAEALAAEGVDILLTEVVLGGAIDGWTLAKLLRHRSPGLPVLFMTGFMVAAQTAFLHGDDLMQFIRKPVETDELLAVIDGMLALSESRFADATD
jgi:CheY-like chemotaxis protein